jgi:hypothetical protein
VPTATYVPCIPRAYEGGLLDTAAWVRDGRGWVRAHLPDGGPVSVNFTVSCVAAPVRRLPAEGLQPGVTAWSAGTGEVLLSFPGGCVQLDYPVDSLGRAELALPRLRDAVRLVPRWRLDQYVTRVTEGRETEL